MKYAEHTRVYPITLSSCNADDTKLILCIPKTTDDEAEFTITPIISIFGEWDDVLIAFNNESEERGVMMFLLNTSNIMENPSLLDEAKKLVDVFRTYDEVLKL